MTELKNNERELHFFRLRLTILGALVFVCFSLLLARFIWLQVIKHERLRRQGRGQPHRGGADRAQPRPDPRPQRRGPGAQLLGLHAGDHAVQAERHLDSVIDELSTLVQIEIKDRKRFKKLLEESKNFESVPLRTRLTDEEVARFTAQRFRFPGVEVQARLFRQYPLGEVASHVIGYIGRINRSRSQGASRRARTRPTTTAPTISARKAWRKATRSSCTAPPATRKWKCRPAGAPCAPCRARAATPGNNLILSIDIELQKVVEEAFGEWRGALVAIEPATGDILAYVSQPGYDPNLFVDGIDQQSWNELNTSLDRPMVNRPLSGTYPPGSTFKPFMALAALELGKRTPSQAISDPGFFILGGHTFRDDKVGGHGTVDMHKSIVVSCNTYYYQLANDMGIDAIHDFMKPFGFGQLTGIDLENEKTGVLPSTEWKRKRFKTPQQQEMGGRRHHLGQHRLRATTPTRRCRSRTRRPTWPTTAW